MRVQVKWLTVFLDLPADGFDQATAFWCQVTGSRLSPFRGERREFATLLPASGDAYLRVQRVGDGGGCHLDLHVESVDAATARCEELGAVVRRREDNLVVMQSPGAFTFCLVPWDSEGEMPRPVVLDGGGTSRADQLCLDIPASRFDSECRFWEALTGWPVRSGALPEFAYLERPDGMPVRLLFQRRAIADPQDRVAAHVDLACQDVDRLVNVHVDAGAQVQESYRYWTTLVDPTDRRYCLTRRDPETGRLARTMQGTPRDADGVPH